MEKKSNKGIIILMIIIIVILAVLCVLFATNTITFNHKEIKNEIENQENTSTVSDKSTTLSLIEATTLGKDLYDKATEIYSTWKLLPYCGYSDEIYNQKSVELKPGTGIISYESMFSNLKELKEYLSKYLSKEIIDSQIKEEAITDINELNDYTDYVIYNNKLYCRQNSGKGWISSYLKKYDIKPNDITDNKITYTITSYYAKDIDKCDGNGDLNIYNCPEENIETKDTNFTIEKVNNNWIVTEYNLHE